MNLAGQWAAQADLQVELTGLPRALVALCPDPQVRPSRLTMRAVVSDDGNGDGVVALEVCRLDLPTITGSAFRCPEDPTATLDIEILTSEAFGALLPTLGLTAFALFSLGKDLAPTPWLASGLLVWLTAAATVLALAARRSPRPGTAYDPASGRFSVPGSVMPLLTILAIFLLKYTLGIELAMQPALRFEASFALAMAAGYGAPSLACSPADRWVCGA